jgi:hypothetical protein
MQLTCKKKCTHEKDSVAVEKVVALDIEFDQGLEEVENIG